MIKKNKKSKSLYQIKVTLIGSGYQLKAGHFLQLNHLKEMHSPVCIESVPAT